MGKFEPAVVFCDTKNKKVDSKYAEALIVEFRKQTGWKVLPGTRIHTDLTAFSRGYSKIQRDVLEVVAIFCLANGIAMGVPDKSAAPAKGPKGNRGKVPSKRKGDATGGG